MRPARKLTGSIAAVAVTLGVLCVASSASASFHLMKIREVSSGTGALDSSYVEIQMYAPSQSFLSLGAQLVRCDSTCSSPTIFSPFSNVASGANQSTVVFGDSGLAAGSKDFNVNLNLDSIAAGGAVCYLSEPGYNDCVSWGNFTGDSTLVANYGTSAGTPAAALASGMALRRSIAAGCPTALDPADDTNNSATDFSLTAPDPRPNSVSPTEMTCGPTGYPTPTAYPSHKKKCKKHKKSSGGTFYAKKKCKKKRR